MDVLHVITQIHTFVCLQYNKMENYANNVRNDRTSQLYARLLIRYNVINEPIVVASTICLNVQK